MFWTECLVCMQHLPPPEPSTVEFHGSHHSLCSEITIILKTILPGRGATSYGQGVRLLRDFKQYRHEHLQSVFECPPDFLQQYLMTFAKVNFLMQALP